MQIDINDKSWMKDNETEGAFTDSITIEVYETRNTRKYQEIGRLIGKYFKVNKMINKQASLVDVFDSIDQNTYELYKAITDDTGKR